MSQSRFGSLHGPRFAGLVGSLAIMLAGCVGSGATSGPSSASPTPESTYIAPGSFRLTPTPESTGPIVVTSEAPSIAPSEAPSVEPSTEPSAGPTPEPTPSAIWDADKATGLQATMVQIGEWPATTVPVNNFVITWKTPTSADTVVRVEGITKCYAPANVTGKDCVTTTTQLAPGTVVLVTHARASALTAKWTWRAWEDIGEAVAEDGAHDYYGIIVTFTTGSTVRVVVLATSQTCPGCTY